jgi:hypothetical protein
LESLTITKFLATFANNELEEFFFYGDIEWFER